MTVHVGIAGWDYPDWNGVVYPARASRTFDRLAHVARYVDVVEINSTFYRPVADRVAASWVRRTESLEGFVFTAKAHRSWTHEPRTRPEDVVAPTLDGLAPIHDAGRLGALLVQFPQSFHHTPSAVERIERLAACTTGWPLVVEVRHASWESDECESRLRQVGVGWCAVDQPRMGGAAAGTLPRVTSRVGYLRLHGRNSANWMRPGVGRDARYDYLYSETELEHLAGPVRRMSETAENMFVVQNNHFRGQALVNALQMKRLLTGVRPAAPEELVATYPDLEASVVVRRQKLF